MATRRGRDRINNPNKKEALQNLQTFVTAFMNDDFTIFDGKHFASSTAAGIEFKRWYKQWYEPSIKKLLS